MEELYKSNLDNKIFVKIENIYQVRNAFAGIIRDEFSGFDYLITKIFLGLDIFAETRFSFKTYVKIDTNFKCKSVIFPRGGGGEKYYLVYHIKR